MFCSAGHKNSSAAPSVHSSVQQFGPERDAIGWIPTGLGVDIKGLQRIIPNVFSDSLTFCQQCHYVFY